MPNFWLGMLMLLLFALYLGCFPTSGSQTLSSLVLPAFTLAFGNMAFISRITRSSMLETIRQDYITTARAKGQAFKVVVRKHALRNALIPIVTVMGLRLCEVFSGSILVELIFSWPGIGIMMFNAISNRDYNVLMGVYIILAVSVAAVMILVDLVYAKLDPRIHYE